MKKGKKKSNKTLTIIALVAVLFIGIGYAGFNQLYKVNGTASLVGHNFAITTSDITSVFTDADGTKTPLGPGTEENPTNGYATMDKTSGDILINFNIKELDLGESYSYDFSIKNEGAYEIKLDSIKKNPYDLLTDVQAYLDYKIYTVATDGSLSELEAGHEIEENKTINVRIVVQYKPVTGLTAAQKAKYPIGNKEGIDLSAEFKFTINEITTESPAASESASPSPSESSGN